MSTVSVLRCTEYTTDILKEKIEIGLSQIGFNLKLFDGKRVVIKPNLLMPAKPEKAIMTDPEFFRAVVRIVKENNGHPVLIESPAIHSLKRTLKKTNYGDVVEKESVEIGITTETGTIEYQEAKSFKHINIEKRLFDSDIIINLPKFKTHGLTYITGAVKNFFGLIPGLEKSKMHMKIPSQEDFSDYLLDLYGTLQFGFKTPKTIITIMDAIVAQEGEGPGPGGTPKAMNSIITSYDAIAVDFIATSIAGLDDKKAFTLVKGFERPFGASSPEDITLVGDPIDELKLSDFKASKGTIMSNMVRWPFTSKRFKNLFVEKPVPSQDRCTLCYKCKKICPAGAIRKAKSNKKIPVYDYKTCIRCYCCMEICPEAAISKKSGRLQWMIRI